MAILKVGSRRHEEVATLLEDIRVAMNRSAEDVEVQRSPEIMHVRQLKLGPATIMEWWHPARERHARTFDVHLEGAGKVMSARIDSGNIELISWRRGEWEAALLRALPAVQQSPPHDPEAA